MSVPFITRCAVFILLVLALPTAAWAATSFLSATTQRPLVGSPVSFTANVVPSIGAGSSTLSFGDGTPAISVGPPYPVTVSHTYTKPGFFLAHLTNTFSRGAFFEITAVDGTPRVPHGIIFSTVPVVSPVLAGDNTDIVITYRVIVPPLGTGLVSNFPGLQAIVDLLDAHGHLVSRGDPVDISAFDFLGGGVVTAQIPYAVPSDARGIYQVRVYLRTPQLGGTVAEGTPARLDIVGGPDPTPNLTAAVHATGSIEVGPQGGFAGTQGTIPNSAATTNLNANVLLAFQNLTYTLSGATTLNPTSRRIDPLLTLVPGTPQVTSPNGQQPVPAAPGAPAQPAPHYQDTLGPVTAQLPSLLFSGGESLRGLDSVVNTGTWNYQAALGYPQLGSATTTGQQGYLLDFDRLFSQRQGLRFTFLQNLDNPYEFVPTNSNQPQNARAGGIQYDQAISSHLTLSLGDALSGATPETLGLPKPMGTTTTDGADKAALNYTAGGSTVSVEYHNFGTNFATGNGLGATSDSAGGSAQASFALPHQATFAVNFAHENKRSAVYGDSQLGATFNIAPTHNLQLSFGGGSDHTLGVGSDSLTRNYNVSIGSTGTATSLSLTGTLATIADTINHSVDGVTRTGNLQYTISHGASNINFGINATQNQIGSPSASVGESAIISFPLFAGGAPAGGTAGGSAFGASHGFEVQLTASNANQRAALAGTRDAIFGALLSYHLGPHISLGLHASTDRHTDIIFPTNDATSNTLRARMDLML